MMVAVSKTTKKWDRCYQATKWTRVKLGRIKRLRHRLEPASFSTKVHWLTTMKRFVVIKLCCQPNLNMFLFKIKRTPTTASKFTCPKIQTPTKTIFKEVQILANKNPKSNLIAKLASIGDSNLALRITQKFLKATERKSRVLEHQSLTNSVPKMSILAVLGLSKDLKIPKIGLNL